jgi:predicted Holliday junction resolvase-like endonuclease
MDLGTIVAIVVVGLVLVGLALYLGSRRRETKRAQLRQQARAHHEEARVRNARADRVSAEAEERAAHARREQAIAEEQAASAQRERRFARDKAATAKQLDPDRR